MIDYNNCIGCQACVDICPNNAINFTYNNFGEGKAKADQEKCVACGLCDKICPAINVNLNKSKESVYAIISKFNAKKGSSGGVFIELATNFITNGGVVVGAGFDENLKLNHLIATTEKELLPLLKSKYLHSDMEGIYTKLKSLLAENKKVMFVGTPCQASAVKNIFLPKYRENLLIVDFLCHGTGTQKVFNACIAQEEKKKGGKITEFYFRSKSKKAEHSFSYILEKDGKRRKISGYAFEFPYYHSYLKYTIFQDACYTCKYATKDRVGDITLGDFWGVQKYYKKLKDYKGVSLICVNTIDGEKEIEQIKDKCFVKEFPIECTYKNQSLIEPVSFPKEKTKYEQVLNEKGESKLVELLSCKNIKKQKIYAKVPKFVKNLYSKLKGN